MTFALKVVGSEISAWAIFREIIFWLHAFHGIEKCFPNFVRFREEEPSWAKVQATPLSFWPHLRENHYTDDGGDHHHIFWAHMENIRPLSPAWILSHHGREPKRQVVPLCALNGPLCHHSELVKTKVFVFLTISNRKSFLSAAFLVIFRPFSVDILLFLASFLTQFQTISQYYF